ncbi:DUF222 domain-containing protein, partial [Specibacter sp. RAF43]|uniref:DUF222 domain-containing protein n=1 Tax=Specibacter sp. RAF43 TaxID=3233057 RepID=UPI003F96AA84
RFSEAGITHPAGVLTGSLLLSGAEANRRLRLAEALLPVTDPLSARTAAPTRPVLGAAFFAGELSAERALLVAGFAADAGHLVRAGRVPAETAGELERTLTGYAREESPDFLRRLGTRALALLDPDGQQPTHGELLARQGL